jgi:hypothetical protein
MIAVKGRRKRTVLNPAHFRSSKRRRCSRIDARIIERGQLRLAPFPGPELPKTLHKEDLASRVIVFHLS